MIRVERNNVEMHGKETEILTEITIIMTAYKETKEREGWARENIKELLTEMVDAACATKEEIEAKELKLKEEIKKLKEEQLLSSLSEEDKQNLMKIISAIGNIN